MKNLVDHLSQYAAYHRDSRNIATHFLGIPLIVLAVTIFLSRPGVIAYSVWISPALLVALASSLFYLRLDRSLGILMSAVLLVCLWIAASLARDTTATWLAWGTGLFVTGWIIQFIGHYYEGRKPAFIDDITGLIIGPLFVAAEVAFLLGMRKTLQQAIEQRAGPVRKA